MVLFVVVVLMVDLVSMELECWWPKLAAILSVSLVKNESKVSRVASMSLKESFSLVETLSFIKCSCC